MLSCDEGECKRGRLVKKITRGLALIGTPTAQFQKVWVEFRASGKRANASSVIRPPPNNGKYHKDADLGGERNMFTLTTLRSDMRTCNAQNTKDLHFMMAKLAVHQ
jgi:hypothetical protein